MQEKEVAAEVRLRSDNEGIVGGEGSLWRVQAGRCKSAAEAGAAEQVQEARHRERAARTNVAEDVTEGENG